MKGKNVCTVVRSLYTRGPEQRNCRPMDCVHTLVTRSVRRYL